MADTQLSERENDGAFLARIGTDGVKWAAEFRQIAIGLGYSDMDEAWLVGWFANAIEAGGDRERRRHAKALADLDNITSIQCADGNWNAHDYMHGMANGMILARATIVGDTPVFLSTRQDDCPDKAEG